MSYYIINDKIKIQTACMESYPCQHQVTINGKEQRMFGTTIYEYLKSKGLTIPAHFECYKNHKEEEEEVEN